MGIEDAGDRVLPQGMGPILRPSRLTISALIDGSAGAGGAAGNAPSLREAEEIAGRQNADIQRLVDVPASADRGHHEVSAAKGIGHPVGAGNRHVDPQTGAAEDDLLAIVGNSVKKRRFLADHQQGIAAPGGQPVLAAGEGRYGRRRPVKGFGAEVGRKGNRVGDDPARRSGRGKRGRRRRPPSFPPSAQNTAQVCARCCPGTREESRSPGWWPPGPDRRRPQPRRRPGPADRIPHPALPGKRQGNSWPEAGQTAR